MTEEQFNIASEDQLLRAEIETLQNELAALKTPHACQDCAFNSLTGDYCTNSNIGPVEVEPTEHWLCGHFKAKEVGK